MAISVMFAGGEANLQRHERGLLHLCEHLRLRSLRREDAYVNGTTSKDWVAFSAQMGNGYIEPVTRDLLLSLWSPELPTEDDVAAEATVVLEEIKQVQASAFGTIQELERAVWQEPFSLPPYGLAGVISGASQKAIADLWRNYFRPENCLITVVGRQCDSVLPVIIETAKEVRQINSESLLQAWSPARSQLVGKRGWTSSIACRDLCEVTVGIPTLGLSEMDSLTLRTIQTIADTIANGPGSFLYEEIRTRLAATYSCESSFRPYGGGSLIYIRVPCSAQHVRQVKESIERLLAGGITVRAPNLRKYLLAEAIQNERQRNLSFLLAFYLLYRFGAETPEELTDKIVDQCLDRASFLLSSVIGQNSLWVGLIR